MTRFVSICRYPSSLHEQHCSKRSVLLFQQRGSQSRALFECCCFFGATLYFVALHKASEGGTSNVEIRVWRINVTQLSQLKVFYRSRRIACLRGGLQKQLSLHLIAAQVKGTSLKIQFLTGCKVLQHKLFRLPLVEQT